MAAGAALQLRHERHQVRGGWLVGRSSWMYATKVK